MQLFWFVKFKHKEKVILRGWKIYFQIFIIGFYFCYDILAQDPTFSQFFANSLFFNPSFAGSVDFRRITTSYRNEWPGFNSKFVTYFASFDQPVELLHGGVGIHIFSDIAGNGTLSKSAMSLLYSYHMRATRDFYLFAGFQTTLYCKNLSGDNLIFPDMIDPGRGIVYPSQEYFTGSKKNYFDFSVGFLGIYKQFFGGIAFHHLAEPNEAENTSTEARLSRKYTLHVGNNIILRNSGRTFSPIMFTPVVVITKQRQFQRLVYGISFSFGPVAIGGWVKQDFNFKFESFIAGVALTLSGIDLTYSYDVVPFGAGTQKPGSGAHEISVTLRLKSKIKRNLIKTINYPKL
jgi:type IX secretion system PorP/SprF family membrane protein